MILFIIIYGSYGITYTKGQPGQFHCPCCATTCAYRHRRVRRFFHIFFVPLIPLTLAGEYVECGQCKGTYKLDVLSIAKALAAGTAPPNVTESQRCVRRVLAMMTLADGRVQDSEIDAITQFLAYAENRFVAREEVAAELEAAKREPVDIEQYCRQMMGFLNEQGRQDVLKAAQLVAAADGNVDLSEQKLLERIGIALGMRPAQVSTNLAAPPRRLNAPFCPRCGFAGRWIQEHQCWGCDNCRAQIPV
ncbi:MAG: TerB family tellurite resistance protein [Deltaproteobacteria bacterium]|nr:TerB family tellurite resistance protein [Deltaproteobacteria bacterium]